MRWICSFFAPSRPLGAFERGGRFGERHRCLRSQIDAAIARQVFAFFREKRAGQSHTPETAPGIRERAESRSRPRRACSPEHESNPTMAALPGSVTPRSFRCDFLDAPAWRRARRMFTRGDAGFDRAKILLQIVGAGSFRQKFCPIPASLHTSRLRHRGGGQCDDRDFVMSVAEFPGCRTRLGRFEYRPSRACGHVHQDHVRTFRFGHRASVSRRRWRIVHSWAERSQINPAITCWFVTRLRRRGRATRASVWKNRRQIFPRGSSSYF